MDRDLEYLMHDWVLLDILCQWSDQAAVLNLRFSDGDHKIVVHGLKKLEMAADYPWGKSVSINRFIQCDLLENVPHNLSIEMQSGDIISIEAELIDIGS